MTDTKTKAYIESIIEKQGIIWLNRNDKLTSIIGVGGTWETAMSLINEQKVFYTKLYQNKVSYISREMYYCLKEFKQTKIMNSHEKSIFELLESSNGLPSKLIKKILPIASKDFTKAMNSLSNKLLITAIRPGKKISTSWSELEWATYAQWEAKVTLSYNYDVNKKRETIFNKLGNTFTEKQVERLIK